MQFCLFRSNKGRPPEIKRKAVLSLLSTCESPSVRPSVCVLVSVISENLRQCDIAEQPLL